jgi:hypothetical protein
MIGITRFFFKLMILAAMLLGLPLGGIFFAGHPVSRYLEFPPKTQYVHHEPFSWVMFVFYVILISACVAPFILHALKSPRSAEHPIKRLHPFPWWGWLGITLTAVAWILAWTRFSWFAVFQPHTFTPLWAGFILVINSLCFRQNGHCMLLDRPFFFLLLFPISSAFWWFFEYLNRFVQNWYYIGPELSASEYFWYATLPFSTVLPAVLGLRDWLISSRWLRQRFDHFWPLPVAFPRALAILTLTLSACGLAGIGIWPNILFPLLWVAPLLIILSLQALLQERHILSNLSEGNWSEVMAAALAAIICGLFWETWNYYSLAKWKYAIPYVQRYPIFEMPLLGYAGYLPFGLQCAAVGSLLAGVDACAKAKKGISPLKVSPASNAH